MPSKRRKSGGDGEDDEDRPRKKASKGAKTGRGLVLAGTLLSNALAALILLGALGAGVLGFFALGLPAVDEAILTRKPNIKVVDSGSWEIANFGDIYGPSIDLRKLPAHVPGAVIAVEDRRFYEHMGVDPRALLRKVEGVLG